MKFDRRDLFLGLPAGLAGLTLLSDRATPQTGAGLKADPAAVNFWTKKMGVPDEHLPPPGPLRAAGPSGSFGLTVEQQEDDMEPFFFYFDDQSQSPDAVLMLADDLKNTHLDGNEAQGSDVKVTFTKKRVRFGDTDRKVYEKYASCGLYLETQQHEEAPAPNYGPMAWSLLSAVLPAIAPGPNNNKKGSKTSSSSSSGAETPAAPVATPKAKPASSSPSSTAPPRSQTVLLPSGMGQSAFACFLKDRQRSRFAKFIDLILPPSSMSQPFAPLLTMPSIGASALSMVRSMVGGLATHPDGDKAGDQLTLFQQAPRAIVATRESKLASDRRALKMRTGVYLLVPKRQSHLLDDPSSFMIADGWLVPKNTKPQQVTLKKDETLKAVSYMTIEVTVERTALATCGGAKKQA